MTTIKCWAAVAYAPKCQMVIEEVFVEPPKTGEVRLRVIANALCHTDIYRLDGHDPEGSFPCILGHEATAVVESLGEGVTSLAVGDIVIPCYTPQCRQQTCLFCNDSRTNLCPSIRKTQGDGLMPDGTSRFRNKQGKPIFHYMGCSTFSQYTVIAAISAAKINPFANLNVVCMIGCGISTGWGAVFNNTSVKPGSTVAVWGLGAVGLSVIQAAVFSGASKIYAIDTNQKKFQAANKFGATVCFCPTTQKTAKQFLMQQEPWGVQYSFDATGNTQVMRQALEIAHRGFGVSCVIGVAEAGRQISTRSFQLVTGRKWVGTAFGGWKSLDDVPKLVNKATLGEWPIDDYVTHSFKGVSATNEAVAALKSGDCLRAVVCLSQPPLCNSMKVKVVSSIRLFGGVLKTVSHWSDSTQGVMTFTLFLPSDDIASQRGVEYPAVYFLSGLSCNHQNGPQKSGFAQAASKLGLAVVFPDTSPRNTGIANITNDWECGDSAGYYVDATAQPYSRHFRMHTYITQELPNLVSSFFPVSRTAISITGFSMGGHGALITALRSGIFKSVSAFAPMANPTQCPEWGQKAFRLFFNHPSEQSLNYDSTEIIKSGKYNVLPLFIDIGSLDQFQSKLLLSNLTEQLTAKNYPYRFESRFGYNHSFYFVSTFIAQHLQFHAQYLKPLTLTPPY